MLGTVINSSLLFANTPEELFFSIAANRLVYSSRVMQDRAAPVSSRKRYGLSPILPSTKTSAAPTSSSSGWMINFNSLMLTSLMEGKRRVCDPPCCCRGMCRGLTIIPDGGVGGDEHTRSHIDCYRIWNRWGWGIGMHRWRHHLHSRGKGRAFDDHRLAANGRLLGNLIRAKLLNGERADAGGDKTP